MPLTVFPTMHLSLPGKVIVWLGFVIVFSLFLQILAFIMKFMLVFVLITMALNPRP